VLQNDVVEKWADDKYVIDGMSTRSQYAVSTAYNTHFMFYPQGNMDKELRSKLRPRTGYDTPEQGADAFRAKGYTFDHPPPIPVNMKFEEFWTASQQLEEENKAKSLKDEAESKHIYLTTGDEWRHNGGPTIIAKDISLFSDEETKSYFLPDMGDIRGQHCRFGMRGVVAEQHWDGHRNNIYMLRGQKRYILNPPGACLYMQMMHEGPSRRHASIDFSSAEQLQDPKTAAELNAADTVETVLRQGEVLYVPSYWLHYIVSTGRSIQCNTRSGISPIYSTDARGIEMCEAGMPPPKASPQAVEAALAKVRAKIDAFRID
jgi:hypothetical protein